MDESKTSLFFVESKEILIYKDTCTVNKHLLSYLDLADTSVEGKRSVLFTLFFFLKYLIVLWDSGGETQLG